jgi:hypothetical protein
MRRTVNRIKGARRRHAMSRMNHMVQNISRILRSISDVRSMSIHILTARGHRASNLHMESGEQRAEIYEVQHAPTHDAAVPRWIWIPANHR